MSFGAEGWVKSKIITHQSHQSYQCAINRTLISMNFSAFHISGPVPPFDVKDQCQSSISNPALAGTGRQSPINPAGAWAGLKSVFVNPAGAWTGRYSLIISLRPASLHQRERPTCTVSLYDTKYKAFFSFFNPELYYFCKNGKTAPCFVFFLMYQIQMT